MTLIVHHYTFTESDCQIVRRAFDHFRATADSNDHRLTFMDALEARLVPGEMLTLEMGDWRLIYDAFCHIAAGTPEYFDQKQFGLSHPAFKTIAQSTEESALMARICEGEEVISCYIPRRNGQSARILLSDSLFKKDTE